MTIMSVGVGNCGCSDFAHIVMYNAFYTQPGRIKAARKVGAGEAGGHGKRKENRERIHP